MMPMIFIGTGLVLAAIILASPISAESSTEETRHVPDTLPCSQCDGDDPSCWRCDGTGTIEEETTT